ncbi:hypothetical protein BJV78DRAFT_210142 [Lactifluus subvellereus]|nr:hypothetical protein BJV78DRAFT_210142 [Lactifluus subvellereus]
MQDTETLIAYMLIEGFLGEAYISNSYGTQVYLTPGRLSQRLDEGQKLAVHFLLPKRAPRSPQTTGGGRKRKVGRRPRISNGSVATHSSEDEDADFGDYSGDDGEDDGEWKGNLRGAPAAKHRTLRSGPRRLSGPQLQERIHFTRWRSSKSHRIRLHALTPLPLLGSPFRSIIGLASNFGA